MDARMMICPTCGARFEAGTSYCPHDGTKLEPLPQPAHPDEGQAEWRVQPRVGELLSRGWELLKADAGKYFLIYLALGIPTIIPGIDSLWTVVSLIFPFYAGGYVIMLRRARGLEPRLEDYGRIFSLAGTLVLVHCVSLALSTVGLILLVVPGIYLLVSYSIAIPLALDRGIGFWQALETSRRVITRRWFTVFGAILATALLAGVGAYAAGAVLGLIAGRGAAALDGLIDALFIGPASAAVVVSIYEAALGVKGEGVAR